MSLGTTIPLPFVAVPLRNIYILQNTILTTEILKRRDECSIDELNTQSKQSRDGKDGFEALHCDTDFVPQNISGDEILYYVHRCLVHQLLITAKVNIETRHNFTNIKTF
ncbi:hypothetical protein AVEN_166956-1 [Araneus ventricosus]|uniref:Uncharacterized protein n=1 Tax=Araneus ventricosus TaxID=182803 RepID=A0A4Y2QQM2_ARAVE|nr:hypothetical protein AVEN_166956-1 [Araneus ventricosus]